MPECIARTPDGQFGHANARQDPNCIRLAELSVDGTSIVTYNEDERLRTFVLPPDLLSTDKPQPLVLDVYATSEPSKSYALALYPGYILHDPSTTLILQSRRDLPIRLVNALQPDYAHASYPLVNPTTEAYVCPHSLAFTPDGSRFIAGSKETISIFDVQRDGAGPVHTLATRAGRKARALYGEADTGLGGLVMALSVSGATGVLAAGSSMSQVALYDHGGSGKRVSSFQLEGEAGSGVTQVKWDAGGRYLFVAGRQSDCLSVFDVRSGRRQCLLKGRRAMTTQRMGFDVVETDGGCDVWAGGTDGSLRIWKNVTSREGTLGADSTMPVHEDAVSSVLMHPGQSVFATTAGQRRVWTALEDDDSESESGGGTGGPCPVPKDVSMKVWLSRL